MVDTVVSALPEGAWASVSLVGPGRRLRPGAASDSRAERLDLLQCRIRQGPVVDAAAGATVDSADLAADPRWPRVASAAREEGAGSVTTVALRGDVRPLGALTVYGPTHVPWRAHSSAPFVRLAAAHAAVAVRASRQVRWLTAAVASRDLIGQAKGVLMERFRITEDAAFGILVKASQDTQRKLRDVAAVVTETGETPGRINGGTLLP
ncbi:ANTAR domain-containing protein [Geodermatophilus sp. TF02-6]|uniref:ANTAR domain-containing protein n=1 Tax=Geodermatophilus sp. TF02-6 TaxID=2250575 RepID=UPI001314D832|nr:ANTAR domain-containing protein [Geodermatophilus sp. TF02-6]